MGLFGPSKLERYLDAVPRWEANASPELQARIRAVRADGVTDEDFALWAMVTVDQKKRAIALHTTFMAAMHNDRVAKGASKDEAIKYTLLRYPLFGDPNSEDDAMGDDRPLPPELEPRVSKWMSSVRKRASGEMDAAGFTSMNALIRHRLRTGAL